MSEMPVTMLSVGTVSRYHWTRSKNLGNDSLALLEYFKGWSEEKLDLGIEWIQRTDATHNGI